MEPARLPDAGVTQLVECDLAKVDVAGSNPVSRSIPQKSSLVLHRTPCASTHLAVYVEVRGICDPIQIGPAARNSGSLDTESSHARPDSRLRHRATHSTNFSRCFAGSARFALSGAPPFGEPRAPRSRVEG